jgi:hypothetical protein
LYGIRARPYPFNIATGIDPNPRSGEPGARVELGHVKYGVRMELCSAETGVSGEVGCGEGGVVCGWEAARRITPVWQQQWQALSAKRNNPDIK